METPVEEGVGVNGRGNAGATMVPLGAGQFPNVFSANIDPREEVSVLASPAPRGKATRPSRSAWRLLRHKRLPRRERDEYG